MTIFAKAHKSQDGDKSAVPKFAQPAKSKSTCQEGQEPELYLGIIESTKVKREVCLRLADFVSQMPFMPSGYFRSYNFGMSSNGVSLAESLLLIVLSCFLSVIYYVGFIGNIVGYIGGVIYNGRRGDSVILISQFLRLQLSE